jgi:DNA-binding CsgD family transcriptional regulator
VNDAQIVGRDFELMALADFVGGAGARALVLKGKPGIGKTTLWSAAIAAAAERGLRVLSARPSGAEAQLSFTALIDLCDGIDTAAFDGVPGPQRAALEVALLRADPADVPPEPQAIALGLLNVLRTLAADGPLLLAIDDVQWLDAASAEALAFAARRLDEEPVGFLLAKRPGRTSPLEKAFEHRALEQIEVGPLSLGATRRILADRLDLSVSRQTLRRIVESAVGNPLFALEVGRNLIERGRPEAGEDIPVPDALEDMLGTRVGKLPDPVRRLLLAVALSGDLPTGALAALADDGAFDDAVDAGVLIVDGDRVRASHPLLAAAARKHSLARERRELHRALADVVGADGLRALHLALATDRPDEELAAFVAAAAAAATVRGGREQAVRLAEHAFRLTPESSPERSERLLAFGACLETAGELQRLADVVRPALEWLPAGPVRARAWMLLSETADVRTTAAFEQHLDHAWDECANDPSLRAQILAKRSIDISACTIDRLGQAEAWAVAATVVASEAGPYEQRLALVALGWVHAMTGRSLDELCKRHRAASDHAPYLAESPERVAGQRLVWRGEMDAARATLTRLLKDADERAEPMSYALQRLHLCELELRAGDWEAAARLIDEWGTSTDQDLLVPPMFERCRALLAAGRGLPEETERWAARAIAGAREVGVMWDELESERARGIAALIAPDAARAAQTLRGVWEHTERAGVLEPGVFPVAPELVEALADLGEHDEARAVTARLGELAERQSHPWGRATARRCDAMVRLAAGAYDEEAAQELEGAAADYEALGLRFDAARSRLVLGRTQRRFKQWGAARATLERAADAFDAIGSAGWAERARAELARVGARRPRPTGELTPTEERVVALAAEGLANKEIARTLFVTVHTVEVHLSRAYAKLGVRSRSQLAGRLAAHGADKD